jgi:3-deoxy-D-manno-octulosonic-acid transferase
LAGDTRFDRVVAIASTKLPLPGQIAHFCKNKKVIVAGSTWEEDEEEIVHYAKTHDDIKFIIAPHNIDLERLADIKKMFPSAVLYSEFISGKSEAQTIIIDNIGMLSKLYQLATVAYVGGGFNDSGIHNILEAAVYGKPVIFGTEYTKFSEAIDLVEREGAFSIDNALELETVLDKFFNNDEFLQKASAICEKYVQEKKGATKIILKEIYKNRLLTN